MICRRGIMLLEVGVAISASAALLYGAVFLFSSFQRIDRTARERVQTSRALVRLGEQFRSDAYAAREVEAEEGGDANLTGGKPLIRFDGAQDERIEYAVGENRQLIRTVAKTDKIVEREVFDLGPGVDYSIEVRRDRVSLVTLIVAMAHDADNESNPPKIQRRVTALMSRDRRYEVGVQKNGAK